jgi:predicted O-methyltransferase YrrM
VVDDWKGGGDEAAQYNKDQEYFNNNDDIFEIFKSNLQPIWDKLNIVRALSKEASLLYKDNSLDFAFIDANHSYESVKEDIELWLPKIKSGGILAGHDYNIWTGVNKAVHEKFANDKIQIIDTSWLVEI